MKLSISNIAWSNEQDARMYEKISQLGYEGLEIAPTRIFSDAPYSHIKQAKQYAISLKEKYNLSISSMQSIWYGMTESIWGDEAERKKLLDYTKSAIDFASAIDCRNIVFGCPKNRIRPDGADEEKAITFFKEIGEYAYGNNTTISLEANPKIYNTNYINTTVEAIELIKKVDSNGLLLNLDIGTIIANNETMDYLSDNLALVNHIHISEPFLKPIEKRDIHSKLVELLKENKYDKYISIEMSMAEINVVDDCLKYIKEICKSGE